MAAAKGVVVSQHPLPQPLPLRSLLFAESLVTGEGSVVGGTIVCDVWRRGGVAKVSMQTPEEASARHSGAYRSC